MAEACRDRREQQRMDRARFIREEPALWFLIFYAISFLGGYVATDLMSLFMNPPSSVNTFSHYISPFGMAVLVWFSTRSWAKRVLHARASDAKI